MLFKIHALLNRKAFHKPKVLVLMLLPSLFFISHCVSNKQTITKSHFSGLEAQKLEQGFKFMEKEEFLKAGQLFDSLGLDLKNSPGQIVSLYNAGLAYKSAGLCKKALSRFRSVLNRSFKDFKVFKARSLLEISSIYECLGDTNLSLSSLKDLEKFLSHLPIISQNILYPGRLSIAWANYGDAKQAETYMSLSLQKILEYKKTFKSEKEMTSEISRLFYKIGRSHVKTEYIKTENFISSCFYHQVFLLQALFLKDPVWSPKAKKEISLLFKKLHFALSKEKDKKKYEAQVRKILNAGSSMIKKEKSKKWESFYKMKSQSILALIP